MVARDASSGGGARMTIQRQEVEQIRNFLVRALAPWQLTHESWDLVKDVNTAIRDIDRLLQPERRI